MKYCIVWEPVTRTKRKHCAQTRQSMHVILKATQCGMFSAPVPWVRPIPSTASRLQARMLSSSLRNRLLFDG